MDTYFGRYVGRLTHLPDGKPYGYIGIASVRKEDGSTANLPTQADLFIHSEDCKSPLWVGMELEFDVRKDDKRGDGFYRAKHASEAEASRLEALSKGGIELALQGHDGGRYIEHTSVFAGWCITAPIAAKIKEKKLEGKAVGLLLVQGHYKAGTPFWGTERRMLVDLAAPIVHLSFNQPGLHRLFALIVWADGASKLADLYLSKNNNYYKTSVVSSEGDSIILEEHDPQRHWRNEDIHFFGSGYIQAELPQTLFAAPPRDWGWVNWMFETKPRDQCAFRRRRILAYTFQPLVAMPVYYTALSAMWLFRLLIVSALLSMGRRGIDYDAIRRFQYPVKWIWSRLGQSVFTTRIGKADVGFLYPLTPAALIVMALITAVFDKVLRVPFWSSTSLWTFGTIFIVCAVACALFSLLEMWTGGIDKAAREAARKELERAEQRQWLEDEVNRLICTATGPKKPDVWQLPIGPRTVRFYAIAVKQMFCKNFVTT